MALQPASHLFRELSSAAVYAELARLSRSWHVEEIEKVVGKFKTGGRRKSFYALRAGSMLKPAHAARLQNAFPRSNIMLWWTHPLAQVLCNPLLSADELVVMLKKIPQGPVRDRIWKPLTFQTVGLPAERLTNWDRELIFSLERIGTPISLFALLTRLRIEQKLSNFDEGLHSAQAAWRMLPGTFARCRNLLVAKDALVLAFDFFLSWQPFADTRIYEMFRLDDWLKRREAVAECERIWLSDTSIPIDTKLLRRSYLEAGLLPKSAGEWGWWDYLYAPDALKEAKAVHWTHLVRSP